MWHEEERSHHITKYGIPEFNTECVPMLNTSSL